MSKVNISNISQITDDDLYIDDDISDQEPESLTSLSWVNIVEDELGESMEEKVLAGSLVEDNTEEKLTDIDDIVKLDCDTICDLNLLEYQTFVSGNLRKMFKNQNDEECDDICIDMVLTRLLWLLKGCEKLSKKLSLEIFTHKKTDIKIDSIPRSSYKFCNFNFHCEYNYDVRKHKGCFAQHYVYNMVYADINATIDYLKLFNDTKNKQIIIELKKSINTISFVINHMYDEFKHVTLCNYFGTDADKLHIDRTPVKRKKQKKSKSECKHG